VDSSEGRRQLVQVLNCPCLGEQLTFRINLDDCTANNEGPSAAAGVAS
jgi:hypothetical protein